MDAGRYFKRSRLNLRGRRPVRADHRLPADEKHIRAQSAILDKSKIEAARAFINNRVFVRMCFSSVRKHGWRAERAMLALPRRRTPEDTSSCSVRLARPAARPHGSPITHGQEAVRTQSAILDKTKSNQTVFLSITLFSLRTCFSSVAKTGFARRARNGRSPTSADTGGHIELRRSILVITPRHPCYQTALSFPAACLRSSSRSRSTRRCTLPVVVMGSASMNSISLGYS